MAKVVFTDYSFDSLDIEGAVLQPTGCEIVACKPITNQVKLSRLVTDADHVVTQFAPVNADVIAAMRNAKVIVRYGVGVDNIDLDAARAKRIPVCNVPDYCMDEVADHTIALLLATTRQMVVHNNRVRNAQWGLGMPVGAMKALRDLTVGVVGFGRIGQEVVHRLKAFKCRINVYDPVVSAAAIEQAGCVPSTFGEILEQSDVITLHCPSTVQTKRMIRTESIARMKKGTIFINVSRGDLVDSTSLVDALRRGHLAAAGLDVFDPEPIPLDHPVLKMDNVVLTPHVASVSETAVRKLRRTVAEIVVRSIRGEPLPNVVNGVQ
jgi:D-3-phosphoglycerate dehydrogenase